MLDDRGLVTVNVVPKAGLVLFMSAKVWKLLLGFRGAGGGDSGGVDSVGDLGRSATVRILVFADALVIRGLPAGRPVLTAGPTSTVVAEASFNVSGFLPLTATWGFH